MLPVIVVVSRQHNTEFEEECDKLVKKGYKMRECKVIQLNPEYDPPNEFHAIFELNSVTMSSCNSYIPKSLINNGDDDFTEKYGDKDDDH